MANYGLLCFEPHIPPYHLLKTTQRESTMHSSLLPILFPFPPLFTLFHTFSFPFRPLPLQHIVTMPSSPLLLPGLAGKMSSLGGD